MVLAWCTRMLSEQHLNYYHKNFLKFRIEITTTTTKRQSNPLPICSVVNSRPNNKTNNELYLQLIKSIIQSNKIEFVNKLENLDFNFDCY